jgi:hypothetical protein
LGVVSLAPPQLPGAGQAQVPESLGFVV